MENHDEFDDLMEEINQSKQGLKGIQQASERVFEELSAPKRTLRPVSRRMIIELMERVRSAETEEEGDAIVKKFFKDVYSGKISPHEQRPTEESREKPGSTIQLPKKMQETLRNCLGEFSHGVKDLGASLVRIEEAMRGLEQLLRAIGNFRPEKDIRMRSMISDLLKLGYSGAEIKELTESAEKYSSEISETEAAITSHNTEP